VSTKGGAFTKEVVEAMARLNDKPIIFALSNPTTKVECTAELAYTWSDGHGLFAAGVQFSEFEGFIALARFVRHAFSLVCLAGKRTLAESLQQFDVLHRHRQMSLMLVGIS
jgi:hypothetical protein